MTMQRTIPAHADQLPDNQSAVSSRLALKGVPRIGFYMGGDRCPEDVPFPSCLRACLDYFGGGLGSRLIAAHDTSWRLDLTFTTLMAISGSAFRLSWRPGWHGDNVEIMYVSDDPAAPFLRAFDIIGYEPVLIDADGRHNDEQLYREAIIRSLSEQGRPVIAFGVIGPPEACLVTGYADGGDTLIGWNYFQDSPEYNAGVEFEPTGEFRKRNWFTATEGLLIFGKKKPVLPPDELHRKALRWALQVIRTPTTWCDLGGSGRHNGIAAYRAWADHLLRDDDFLADLDLLRKRFMVHDDAVSTVAEGRWYAAQFMDYLAEQEPAMEEDLLAAADCFECEHDRMWQIWELVGGNGRSDEHVRCLASPSVRRAIVPLILESQKKDTEAAKHIERALERG